jgi:hypothetical protein
MTAELGLHYEDFMKIVLRKSVRQDAAFHPRRGDGFTPKMQVTAQAVRDGWGKGGNRRAEVMLIGADPGQGAREVGALANPTLA